MQFFILLTGIMVFVFYQFHHAPLFFNQPAVSIVADSEHAPKLAGLQAAYEKVHQEKKGEYIGLIDARKNGDNSMVEGIRSRISELEDKQQTIRADFQTLLAEEFPEVEKNDRDYVFLSFILDHLPKGLIGLLLAVIFSAAMSSTSAELNALASTTTVDIYKRSIFPKGTDHHYLRASKFFTLFWGMTAILFATFGTLFENLIQLVNIVGSIFYGTILGIFIVAFYIKKVGGHAVFTAAVIAETIVLLLFFATELGYLWYNVIGCLGVVILSVLFELLFRKAQTVE